VAITFDPAKRELTLKERELDFEDAAEVFAGPTLTEERYHTFGYLRGRMVVVVWTQRGEDRRIISMRKANAREQAYFGQQLGEAGRDDG
jgi:uncharacterized DUF497 family protein